MTHSNRKQYFLDLIGLMLIGLVSIGYIIFVRPFAELHLQFPFLNFPIFVGEILLFICLILFCVKYCKNLQQLTKWQFLIICYFVFVIFKALYGYLSWGPLAFRHAALLYYPAFAVFGYAFYRRDFFGEKTCLLLFFILSAVIVAGSDVWRLTLMALGFILIVSHPHKILQFLMLVILLIITPYKEFFYASRMMIVANLSSGLFLAGALPIILKMKKEFKLGLMMLIAGVVMLGFFKLVPHAVLKSIVNIKGMTEVFKYHDIVIKANVRNYKMNKEKKAKLYNPERKISAPTTETASEEKMKMEIRQVVVKQVKAKIKEFSFEEINGEFVEGDIEEVKQEMVAEEVKQEMVAEEVKQEMAAEEVKQEMILILEAQFQGEKQKSSEPLQIEIVQDEDGPEEGGAEAARTKMRQILFEQVKQEIQTASVDQVDEEIPLVFVNKVKEEMQVDLEKGLRLTVGEHVTNNTDNTDNTEERVDNSSNVVFRLLIWRDMLVELVDKKPILGFDFGKPFRSISLEILQWGYGDWFRDGWIGAHNSYLHIIYRTGIVGILLIFSFLVILFKMIKQFIESKSITGILLCAIIINWFAAANFLLIFELPYTAIPIWTIYGMTFAYYHSQTKEGQHSISIP